MILGSSPTSVFQILNPESPEVVSQPRAALLSLEGVAPHLGLWHGPRTVMATKGSRSRAPAE